MKKFTMVLDEKSQTKRIIAKYKKAKEAVEENIRDIIEYKEELLADTVKRAQDPVAYQMELDKLNGILDDHENSRNGDIDMTSWKQKVAEEDEALTPEVLTERIAELVEWKKNFVADPQNSVHTKMLWMVDETIREYEERLRK